MTEQLHTNNEKQNKAFSLFVLYAIVTCAIYILPALVYRTPYVIAGCLMLISFPVIMLKDSRSATYGIWMLFATILLFISNMLFSNLSMTDATNDAIRNIRFFLPVLWSLFALKYCNDKQKKTLLIFLLIITAFVYISTMVALEEEPWIARLLAEDKSTSSNEVNIYRLRNVGGYSFSYMMGIVTLVFSWLSVKLHNIPLKILCITATVFCFYYIIQTMYTTLLLLCSIGLLIILFMNIKSHAWRLVVLVLSFALWFSLPLLFGVLSDAFSAESLLSTKFAQMQAAMTGEGLEALGSRPELLSQAFENWLKTPIFGSHYDNPSHSLFFEYLQQNGIVGLAIWSSTFIMSWRFINHTLKEKNIDTTLFNICMCYLSALSIFNDTRYTFEITITTFFIVPVFSKIFCKKQVSEG